MKKFLFFVFILFYQITFAQNSVIEFHKLNDSVFIHTSYKILDGYNVPSNGLIILTDSGLVLVDTPWDDEQTSELLKQAKDKFGKEIIFAFITHAHDDRIGGIKTLQSLNIEAVGIKSTSIEAAKNNFPSPKVVSDDSSFSIGNVKFHFYYPGAGHTIDNSVVYLPDFKVLFGGCLLKSLESNSKGNIADADLTAWPKSVKNLKNKFSDVKIVIPGHGSWGNSSLLQHTIVILEK